MAWSAWLAIAAVGAGVGFLGGLFGKGGSAVATPLLAAVGVAPIVAVAAPLPAAIPGTLAASAAYWSAELIDWHVLRWSVGLGVPATIGGAVATRWIGGGPLVLVTEILVIGLGLRFLVSPGTPLEVVPVPPAYRFRLAAVAVVAGVVSGLLANSGGLLLAPLYVAVLRMPLKEAFASSLAVSATLAVPGTVVHAALGHIHWAVVVVFACASIPLSYLGARVALRTLSTRLERYYGGALTGLGIALLAINR